MTADLFAKRRIELQNHPRMNQKEDVQQEIPQKDQAIQEEQNAEQNPSEDFFNKRRINLEPEKQKTLLERAGKAAKETGRHIGRSALRIAENVGGQFGEISGLIKPLNDVVQSGVTYALEKLTGIELPEEKKELLKSKKLPVAKDIREYTKNQIGDFFEPKSEGEKKADEVFDTIGTLIGPFKTKNAAMIGLGSTAFAQGLDYAGVNETGRELGKIGSQLILSTINPAAAEKASQSLFNLATTLRPNNVELTVPALQNSATRLYLKLNKGLPEINPDRQKALTAIESVVNRIKNGKIPLEELIESRKDLNKLIFSGKELAGERKVIKHLNRLMYKEIEKYGKTNPKFFKTWRQANDLHAAVSEGKKAANFISKYLDKKHLSFAALTLGHEFLMAPQYVPHTIGAIAGGYSAVKGWDLLTRIMKNPTAFKFYSNIMGNAILKNAPAMEKSADKLDKILKKEKD